MSFSFFTIGYVLKTSYINKKSLLEVKYRVIILLLLTYFTHLFALGLSLFSLVIIILYVRYKDRVSPEKIILFMVSGLGLSVYLTIKSIKGLVVIEYSDVNLISILGKMAKLRLLLNVFEWDDLSYLLLPLSCILILILLNIKEIKNNFLPWLLCLLLFVLYLIIPLQIGALIRPQERVLHFVLFLLPICCTHSIKLNVERIIVVSLSLFTVFHATKYFNEYSDAVCPDLQSGRRLFQSLSPGKTLMPLLAANSQIGRVNPYLFLDAYYLIDKNGYVPSLFSETYMMVKYREKPNFSYNLRNVSTEMLTQYDYLLVRGAHIQKVNKDMREWGFALIKRAGSHGVYLNISR
jgi:hypothetical protein